MEALRAAFLGIAITLTVMFVLALATMAWGQVLKLMDGYGNYTPAKKVLAWCFVVAVVIWSWCLYLLMPHVA